MTPQPARQIFTLESVIRTFLVFVLAASCIMVLLPFLGALTWAAIIAISVWPVFERLRRRLGGRSTLASVVVMTILSLCVIVPIALMGLGMVNALPSMGQMVSGASHFTLPDPPRWIGTIPLAGNQLLALWHSAQTDLPGLLAQSKPFLDDVASWLLRQGMTLGKAVIEVALALVIAALFLVAGDKLWVSFGRAVVKIGGEMQSDLPEVIAQTVRSVTTGVVGTALVQAILTVIGLLIAGVPGAMVMGFICFIIAVAQMPTFLVWAPAVVWLAMTDQTGMAIFLGLWGLLLVNTIDNFLKPYLISHGAGMPLSLIFLGVLGGLLSIGLLGLFIGPTLLAVAYRLLRHWLEEPVNTDQRELDNGSSTGGTDVTPSGE